MPFCDKKKKPTNVCVYIYIMKMHDCMSGVLMNESPDYQTSFMAGRIVILFFNLHHKNIKLFSCNGVLTDNILLSRFF